MKRFLIEFLSLLLISSSLVILYQCVVFLTRRDYMAATLLAVVAIAVIRVGADLARFALHGRK